MEIKMLKCGCNGMASHGNIHDGLEANHPTCIVHECCVIVATPDFKGRIARCTDYGKQFTRRGRYANECDDCAKRQDDICHCERPSSNNLAFFGYKLEKEYDEFYCGCLFGWD